MATTRTARDRVLIVLDDDRIAAVMQAAVERASYRPVVVPDAERARALLEHGLEPCAVLLALGRTEDGREFVRRHTADARTARIPIIFFTPATIQTRDSPIVTALVAFVRTHCGPSPGTHARAMLKLNRRDLMIEIGYKLSAEEFGAADLVRYAARAEQAGFEFALISDHFHPWNRAQGESPFVWSVLGAIAQATERLRVGTAVTCPTMRIHPAIIAQAAATTASLMPGRFVLGLGTGENLNEHILGRGWPSADVRLEMLTEAVDVIRLLWEGGVKSHRGQYFTVEDAELFSLPENPPEVMIAASKRGAAELAARAGDAMINTQVSPKLVKQFQSAGGKGKPCYMELGVCWAEDEKEARQAAHEIWPLAALEDPLFTELAQPSHFEAAFAPISEDKVAEAVLCGPDPDQHVEKIREAERAGYTHVCVHQIGHDQEGFFAFYERDVLPRLGRSGARSGARTPSLQRKDSRSVDRDRTTGASGKKGARGAAR